MYNTLINNTHLCRLFWDWNGWKIKQKVQDELRLWPISKGSYHDSSIIVSIYNLKLATTDSSSALDRYWILQSAVTISHLWSQYDLTLPTRMQHPSCHAETSHRHEESTNAFNRTVRRRKGPWAGVANKSFVFLD